MSTPHVQLVWVVSLVLDVSMAVEADVEEDDGGGGDGHAAAEKMIGPSDDRGEPAVVLAWYIDVHCRMQHPDDDEAGHYALYWREFVLQRS